MSSRKRNQADGHLRPSSAPLKRPSFDMEHPEAEPRMSSLDSEGSCLIQPNFPMRADDSSSLLADRRYSVAVVGKRSSATHHQQRMTFDAEEERSKRSRIEYSDATVSGVTFQNDSNLHHASRPDAESDAASVARHVGSCQDSVCLNSRRSKFVTSCCSTETDGDTHGTRRKGADKYATYISSRAQESKGNMLTVARQGTRETTSALSSVSCCQQSRDGSHSISRITSFPSRFRDLSRTSPTHGQNSEAGSQHGLASLKHVIGSPQISSAESRHAFLNVDTMRLEDQHTSFFNVSRMRLKSIPVDTMRQDASLLGVGTMRSKGSPADTLHSKGSLPVDTMHSKDSPPSYVLSSGRLCIEQEAKLGRRLPTIDDDFEEYFSSLML